MASAMGVERWSNSIVCRSTYVRSLGPVGHTWIQCLTHPRGVIRDSGWEKLRFTPLSGSTPPTHPDRDKGFLSILYCKLLFRSTPSSSEHPLFFGAPLSFGAPFFFGAPPWKKDIRRLFIYDFGVLTTLSMRNMFRIASYKLLRAALYRLDPMSAVMVPRRFKLPN